MDAEQFRFMVNQDKLLKMSIDQKDPMGQAIVDFAKTNINKDIIVVSEICDDDVIPSEYLFRAAQLQEVLGKTDDAVAIYKDIKAKYPKTQIGLNVDKFIFKLKVQP